MLKLSQYKVSVIVVNYNCYNTLDDCILSILDSKDVEELLLVDNGSTDGSMRLIDKYTDPRLKIIRLDHNIGLAAAGNLAAAHTRNPYIAFADADAKVDPEWLGVPCFLLETHKEIGAVTCNIICSKFSDKVTHDSARVLLDGHEWIDIPNGKRIPYFRWLFPNGAAFVVKRDVWNLVKGFDPTFFVGNGDVDFGIRLWLIGYEVVMSSEGTVYHEGGGLRSRKDISSIFLFYEIKTTLSLWIKNLERKTLITQVLPFSFFFPLMAFWRGRVMGVKGLISFMESFPSLLISRVEVQKLRRTSDNKIMPLMRSYGIMPIQLLIQDFKLFYKKILKRT